MIILGLTEGTQFIGEVDVAPGRDQRGFILVKYPMIYQEQVQANRVGLVMKPLSALFPTSEWYVRISAWRPLDGKHTVQIRGAYDQAVQQERSRETGLVLASSVPTGGPRK